METKFKSFGSGVPPNAAGDAEKSKKAFACISTPVEKRLEGQVWFACLKNGVTACYSSVTPELEKILSDSGVIKIFHNSAGSISQLRQEGFEVNNTRCLTLMAKVLGEQYTDLNFLSYKYLDGILQTDQETSEVSLLKSAVQTTYHLYEVLWTEIIRRGLSDVYYRENEANAVIPRLNCDGVLFQYNEWDEYLNCDRAEISELEKTIKAMLNSQNLDLSAHAQVIQALQSAGVLLHSLSDESLMSIETLHPAIPLLLRYRKKLAKVRMFGDKLQEHIGSDGRLRGSWKIIGCRSGRMSCTSPPLQAMPGKSKSFFVPAEGNVFIVADYSQIELRVLAEISGDETIRRQFIDGADLHSGTASLIFEKSIDKISQEERQIGKSLNFGMVYGITEFGIRNNLLRNDINITLEKAAHFRSMFLGAYPKVSMLQECLLKSSVVKSLGGRSWDCSNLTLTQRLNYPIQGTAADGLKEALITLNKQMKESWKLCAVVHDEVLLEVPKSEAEDAKAILERSMISGMEKFVKSIPVVVETTIGYNWNKKGGK